MKKKLFEYYECKSCEINNLGKRMCPCPRGGCEAEPVLYEYKLISDMYGDRTTERSQVKLINHIKEGLIILDAIKASEEAKRAYCLHPILQDDRDFLKNYNFFDFRKISSEVLILTMEYRSIANAALRKEVIDKRIPIQLSVLQDVNDMLIADKIQNFKDFELYHKGTHEYSEELTEYFTLWLTKLGILDQYEELKKLIS